MELSESDRKLLEEVRCGYIKAPNNQLVGYTFSIYEMAEFIDVIRKGAQAPFKEMADELAKAIEPDGNTSFAPVREVAEVIYERLRGDYSRPRKSKDVMISRVMCPECAQDKHGNCTLEALDPETDKIVHCQCAADGHRKGRL